METAAASIVSFILGSLVTGIVSVAIGVFRTSPPSPCASCGYTRSEP